MLHLVSLVGICAIGWLSISVAERTGLDSSVCIGVAILTVTLYVLSRVETIILLLDKNKKDKKSD